MTRFEVQHFTICDGWVNCWSDIDDDGNETPTTYDTFEAAQADLDEFFADVATQIANGERQPDEDYDRNQFRIVQVTT